MNIEEYLLTCLGEEGGELAQAASKANRFGLDDQWTGKATTNRQDIKTEFNDIIAVLELLQANGILEKSPLMDRGLINTKKAKLARMMLYSSERGRVTA